MTNNRKVVKYKMLSFNEIWDKIRSNSGQVFRTITGKEFTYSVIGNYFLPSRTGYRISKKDFEKAYEMLPLDGPGKINNIVRGPSYVWAVLNDKRINI